jgi:hypothetical protein
MKRTIAHVLAAGLTATVLAGCAVSTAGTATGSAPVAGCGGGISAAQAPVAIGASLHGGQVHPAPQRVDVPLGAPVVIRVDVDVAVMVHVHGYERMADALPGVPACLEVVADVPGVFEVYAHPVATGSDAETLLFQLAVR